MKYLYIFVTLMIIFELIQKWYLITTQRKEYRLFVSPSFTCCIISILVTYFIMFSKNIYVATFFYGCNFICLDAIVYSVFMFVRSYAVTSKKYLSFRIGSIAFMTVDCILIILNNFFHFYFLLNRELIRAGFAEHWGLKIYPFMYFHYIGCFAIIVFSCYLLLKKTIEVPSIYKRKYLGFMILYFSGVMLSYVSNFFNFAQDYALYLYAFLGNAAFRYSLVTADGVIKLKAMQNIVQTYSIAVCWFNRENKKIYTNTKADEIFKKLKMDNFDINDYLKSFIKRNYARNLDVAMNDEIFEVDGNKYYYEVTYRRIYSNREYIGCYLHFKDITEEKIKKIQEEHQLNTDELTGFYNKKHFFEVAERKVRDNPDVVWLMICSNIKDFKIINNLFGRKVGDNILLAQADVIRNNAHAGTVYGRIMDDKFAILMDKQYYDEDFFMERIIDVAKVSKNKYYHMSQQIGIYESVGVRESVQFMYDKALMAVEKSAISNKQIAYYDDSIMKKFLHERNIISDFDFAFNSSQFVIYLQPVFNEKDKVIGGDVFVRWNRTEVGLLQPEEFLPLFEKTEIINKLDMFIWEKSVQQLGRWAHIGKEDLFLTVNISPYNFNYVDVPGVFKKLLEQYNFNPKKLKLSFSENGFENFHDKMIEAISRLKAIGFEIEIAGLGNYCFSINNIDNVDVDYFKIDMNMFKNYSKNDSNFEILKSILDLSKQLNLEIIGKNIENQNQLQLLKDTGCKIYQGYYLGEPVTRINFEEKYL